MRHLHPDTQETEISDELLIEAVSVDTDLHLTDYEYDIPYTAGSSQLGVVIYLDRSLADASLVYRGQRRAVRGDLDRGIIVHEVAETARLRAWERAINARWTIAQQGGAPYTLEQRAKDLDRLYLHAHQYAEREERDVVQAVLGLPWEVYDAFWAQHIAEISDKRIQRCPPDLYLKPYEYEHDLSVIAAIRAAGGPTSPLLVSE